MNVVPSVEFSYPTLALINGSNTTQQYGQRCFKVLKGPNSHLIKVPDYQFIMIQAAVKIGFKIFYDDRGSSESF